MKSVIYKNIVANLLVLIFGYFGMELLIFLNPIFPFPVFNPQFTIGIILIILGVIIRIWSTLSFNKKGVEILEMSTHPALITNGIFKYSRNPLYVGIMLVTLGFVLLSGSWLGILLSILFFMFWNLLIVNKEEKELEKQFGQKYIEYKSKTRRWL